MHECASVQDWIRAWGDPEGDVHRLVDCPRCSPHRPDLSAWLAAIARCGACKAALEATPVLDAEAIECPRCMEAFGRLHEILDELEHFDPAVAAELLAADELMPKLVTLAPKAQVARVTDDLRYQQWGLAQTLLASARELWCNQPITAHHRARAAVAIADLLDPETYHPRWTADLRAKAYAYLANTYRILGEFQLAEREFGTAEHHLWQGVGSGRARVQVFSLKASLLVDQRRFVEAGALLDSVFDYYQANDDRVGIARTHLQRSLVADGTGDLRGAAAECARATEVLDREREPWLHALACQNTVEFVLAAGEVRRARALFDELPPAPDRWMALCRRWIEGNLHRAEGSVDAAHAAYHEARRGFSEDGRPYQAALVSLEEAAMALDHGEHFDALAMAQEASVLLVRGAARQEALATLRLLLTALERGVADRTLVLGLARRIAAFQPS